MPRTSGSKPPPESIHSDEETTVDLTSDVAGSKLVPPSNLKHIWDAHHIESYTIGGVAGWKCKWCGKPFKRKHGTRVLWHHLKISGQGIAVCLAIIPQDYISIYQELYNRNIGRAHARFKSKSDNEACIADRQHDAVSSISAKRAVKTSGVCLLSGLRRELNRESTQSSLGFQVSVTKKR